MSFALPASLLEQGENIIPDIHWDRNRLFEGANERVYNNFGVELPESSRQTVSAARRAAQRAGPLLVAGGAAVTYASKYIPALGQFEEQVAPILGTRDLDDEDKSGIGLLLDTIKEVDQEDEEMASNKRAKVGGEPSNTTQVTNVDGEPRIMGASGVPLQNSADASRPPLMDRIMRVADLSNIPMQQESARMLNTLEPTCCRGWKFYDYGIGSQSSGPSTLSLTIGNNGQYSEQVNTITQGVGDNQRIGTRICMHCMEIRYTIRPASGTSIFQPYRVIIAYDHQSQSGLYNGGPGGVTNTWANGATCAMLEGWVTGQVTPTNFYNRSNRDRYDYLFDKLGFISSVSPGTTQGGQAYDCGYQIIPMHNRETIYISTDATGRTTTTGAVWICTIGGNGTTLSNCSIMEGYIRVYFSEKADKCT